MSASFGHAMLHWRQQVQQALALPDWNLPKGWSISKVDLHQSLAHLPNLALRHGWKLVAYQFFSRSNGNAIVYAVPDDETVPLPGECEQTYVEVVPGVVLSPPRPKAAAGSFMDAIVGDGTDEAYVQTSVLFRKLGESAPFGTAANGARMTSSSSDHGSGVEALQFGTA